MFQVSIPRVERYVPALDGMRAGSVLLVILSHFGLDNVLPGGFGVTVFFWISGFLITSQLVAEIQRNGRINLGNFYLRRFLRLMPASVFYISVAGLGFILAGGTMTPVAWLATYFYGANYYDLFFHYPWLTEEAQNPFTHLWSLAVEEHYYIVWPVALAFLVRRNIAVKVLIALCVVVLAWRFYLYQTCFIHDAPGPPGGVCGDLVLYRTYKATDTRLDSIAWGALLALLAASDLRGRVERLLSSPMVLAAAGVMLLLTFVFRGGEFREVWRYTMQGVALTVLIPAVCGTGGPLRWLLERPPLVVIGRLSYSLYLWHWGAITYAAYIEPTQNLAWVARGVMVTVLGALFSYYAIERPMVALRRRAGSHAVSALAQGD